MTKSYLCDGKTDKPKLTKDDRPEGCSGFLHRKNSDACKKCKYPYSNAKK